MKITHVLGAALLGLAFGTPALAQVMPVTPGAAGVGSPSAPINSANQPTTTPGVPVAPGTTVIGTQGTLGTGTVLGTGTAVPGSGTSTIPTDALPGGTRPVGVPATGSNTRATRSRTRTTTTPATRPGTLR